MSQITADNAKPKSGFFEGGNMAALIVVPVGFVLSIIFYRKVSTVVGGWGIKVEDVYTYVFNLFAIQFGALLALFALLACKPTPFLERIKSTHAFAAILTTTKITMAVATVVIASTFVLGLIRLEPESVLSMHSIVFLVWVAVTIAATMIYARAIRLIFLALA